MIRRRFSLAFATLIASCFAVMLTGCGADRMLGINQGRVRVVLAGDGGASADLAGAASADVAGKKDDQGDDASDDRPSRWFRAANVTLSSILVRNLDGVVDNIVLPLPVTVDVVKLEDGRHVQLPDGIIPVGIYDEVIIVITAVQGVLRDGTIVTLQPPGGGWTAIVPICPMAVTDGGTATVGLDLIVRGSFHLNDNHFHFQPRFRSQLNCND